jgi:hypothetical protein
LKSASRFRGNDEQGGQQRDSSFRRNDEQRKQPGRSPTTCRERTANDPFERTPATHM